MGYNTAANNFRSFELVETSSELSEKKIQELRLRDSYKRLIKKEKLSTGQLVKWKVGLCNRKRPYPGEPAIVTKVLDAPIYDPSENNSASQFFREPLNVVIGIWDEGDFNELHVDGRRLEPYSL